MRITNQMMINSSIANIQTYKSQINTMDTQLSTQKKINKPSDDPIIAIRALRLRSCLDQVTHYINKNLLHPDYNSYKAVILYCNSGQEHRVLPKAMMKHLVYSY